MKRLEIQQNTAEWRELRKTKIGASDAPIIMEQSPFATPYQLWQQKLDLIPQQEMTASMQRGLTLEAKARAQCEIELGAFLLPCVALHLENEWMIASFDGIDPEGKKIVEIKCPNKIDHEMATKGIVPEKYYAQLQHQMAVAELDKSHYYSFDGIAGILVIVDRNDTFIKEMILKERQFFDCMNEFIPPELIDNDYTEITDAEWLSIANEYKIILEKEAEIIKKKEVLRSELISGSQGLNIMGNGLKLSKVTRKGNIDYSKIPELHNVDLNRYRKPTTSSWRIQSK